MQNTILLIEDNPDDATLALEALYEKEVPAELTWVKDGKEALDYLFYQGAYEDRSREQPRLILLDLQLPFVNGMEVLRRIRANESTRLIPVLILSTSDQIQDVKNCYRLGANSYVKKPVDYEHFLDFTAHLGSYWLGHNQQAPV